MIEPAARCARRRCEIAKDAEILRAVPALSGSSARAPRSASSCSRDASAQARTVGRAPRSSKKSGSSPVTLYGHETRCQLGVDPLGRRRLELLQRHAGLPLGRDKQRDLICRRAPTRDRGIDQEQPRDACAQQPEAQKRLKRSHHSQPPGAGTLANPSIVLVTSEMCKASMNVPG